MINGDLNWITNFIWGIADDALRDLYVRGKYRGVMAHGNIDYLSDGKGQIHALRLWNTHPRTQARTWGAVLPVAEIRRFLGLFVELIERRHKDFGWYERGAA